MNRPIRNLVALTFALHLLVGFVFAQFDLKVSVPDDPDVGLSFGRAEISEMTEILSVTTPAPHLIMGDESGTAKNKIAFRGSLPNCDVPVTIIGKKPDGTIVKYTGSIKVTPVKTTDIKHGVVVQGNDKKIKELVDKLDSKYDVTVVSNTPKSTSNPTDKVAIILREKGTGKVIPKDEAEKAIDEEIKKIGGGVSTDKPDCYSTCKEICTSRLTLDASADIMQTAVVPSERGTFYSGMPTKLVHKCGKDVFKGDGDGGRVCTTSTCANGGSCATSTSGTSSNICTCRVSNYEIYGPRCQLLTRSYLSTGPTSSAITHHNIPYSHMHTKSLTLYFQHAGQCTLTSGSLCTILKLEAGSKELLKVEQGRTTEPRYNSATLPSRPDDTHKMVLYSDRFVQNKRWLDVTVSIELAAGKLKATTVFCSKEVEPVCFEKKAEHTFVGNLRLENVIASIGGTFKGCFRSVRLNGRLVDLQPNKVTGAASLTRDGCAIQSDSCGGSSGYTCGTSSLCYGQLGNKSPGMTCGCRCTNNKRMELERVTKSTKCAKPCSKDAPIITTSSSSHILAWEMKNGGHIGLMPQAPFKLELRFRTRQADAPAMLRAETASTGGPLNIEIKLQGEILTCCVGGKCFKFVPIPVNDGLWHEIAVRMAATQLVTRVDDYASIHKLDSAYGVTGAKLAMDLPGSCITGVRLSDIYMPATSGDTTQDSADLAVKLTAGSGATAGSTCADPGPACGCNAATEDCNASQWGPKACRCKPGHKRYGGSGSSCQSPPAGNPCTRLGIKCPIAGGACTKSSTGKWRVCE